MDLAERDDLAEYVSAARAAAPKDFLLGEGKLLFLWEWRIHQPLAGSEERGDEDGGVRIERVDLRSGRSTRWRFLVGAEPVDFEQIWSGERGVRPPGRFAEAVRRTVKKLCAREGRLAPHEGQGTLWARARAWCLGDDPVRFAWEHGVRRGPSGTVMAPAFDTAGGTALPAVGEDYHGPVVLRARAAAWFAHEMGHAALEAECFEAIPGGAGARLIEEPFAGEWPAGFAFDDLGHSAGFAVLWDGAGLHPPCAAGHFRRASIRDPALPALSVTRLDARNAPRRALSSFSVSTPIVDSVFAGRYDPLSKEIYLAVRLHGEPPVGSRSRRLIQVRADRAWAGYCAVDAGEDDALEFATCTRQGFMHAVMVGAPTSALDSVRLVSAEASMTKGLER